MTIQKEDQAIHLTYRAVLFGGQFWQKLVQTPCPNDKNSYAIHKLNERVERARKKLAPIFQKFVEELSEFGERDVNGKVIIQGNLMPKPDPAMVDAYEDKLEEFMGRIVDVDWKKLSLEGVAHIQKTPMDWQLYEHIVDVSPQILDEAEKSKNKAHEALRSIHGG